MKTILLLTIGMMCLNGCTSGEVKPFDDYEYNVELYKTESPDNRELFEVKCFKRKYHIGLDFVGAAERFKEAPLKECEKIFGFKPEAKGNLWALMEYVRKEAVNCNQETRSIEEMTGEASK